MCGIFGVINFNGSQVEPDRIIEARDCIAHRGPDDSGIFLSADNSAALAHCRLSIIDLSSLGHQPMTTEDGRFTIVHNGEIYNYKQLTSYLASSIQHPASSIQHLASNSDTEVLLKLYATEGAECLKELRGMFAFAVWDEKEKKLFAARDRFGIKPFYYTIDNASFIFSSELSAIKKYKGSLSISQNGLYSFLRNGSVTPPLTIYENVYSLLPGHYLTLDRNGKSEIKQYWQFSDLIHSSLNIKNSSCSKPYDVAARAKIGAALLDSIKAHCVSDVEVGAFLSGGIDSTAIVSLMRRIGHEKIKTISITIPGDELDESKFSNIASRKYGTDHFEYRLTEDEVIKDLDKIFDSMDQPTIDGVNTYFVSKVAHSLGLKVVMSGLGGDELFGGYPVFKFHPWLEKYLRVNKYFPFSRPLLRLTAELAKNRIPSKGEEFLKYPDSPNASYRLFRGFFTNEEISQLGFDIHSFINHNSLPKADTPLAETIKQLNLTPLQHVSYLESTQYMANQLLRDSDVFSMLHSLELRVPFVDHLLYAAVLPYLDSGYNTSFTKKMLVEAVGDLPDEIVHRPKMTFTFPFAEWMKNGKLKGVVKEKLSGKNSFLDLNSGAVEKMFTDFENGKVHWSRVWALTVLQRFS